MTEKSIGIGNYSIQQLAAMQDQHGHHAHLYFRYATRTVECGPPQLLSMTRYDAGALSEIRGSLESREHRETRQWRLDVLLGWMKRRTGYRWIEPEGNEL